MTPLLDAERARHAVTTFDLPDELNATSPPETRGVARDAVRLLVASESGTTHARFADLPLFLREGDLVVVNNSATLPAAVDGRRESGPVTVHFSTALDDGTWLVELRPGRPAAGPVRDARAGEFVWLPDGDLTLLEGYPGGGARSERLWRARVDVPGTVRSYVAAHGHPISYAYLQSHPSLDAFQTVFAREPGSAEMPSAGRPFSDRLVTELVVRGVVVAPITLHTGVSSLEEGEAPLPEPFHVPAATARLVNLTRAAGGRVIAVGTTVTRALESAALPDGTVAPAAGWTDLVLSPDRPARVVDGLVTGWHAPGASHLMLLESVAGADLVQRAYAEAVRARYLWHEFGDSCLLLPAA